MDVSGKTITHCDVIMCQGCELEVMEHKNSAYMGKLPKISALMGNRHWRSRYEDSIQIRP